MTEDERRHPRDPEAGAGGIRGSGGPIAAAEPLPETDLTLATAPAVPSISRWRTARSLALFIAGLLVVWEGVKALGGDTWRAADGAVLWDPPLKIGVASDAALPHVWNVVGALFAPVQRGASQTLAEYLLGAAFYTWREAAIGFGAGALLGLALASVFVHSRTLERGFVPYVIASQTIPILALAPMIVFAFGQSLLSVVIVATYLTFFPVTIAMMRGLTSPDPRALELMRSYASSKWIIYRKLRLPASVPYLFTALKIAATASIVGAIIGEGPGGIPNGLGRALINFNEQYSSAPEKLWATIFIAALLGIAFFLVIRLAESRVVGARTLEAEA